MEDIWLSLWWYEKDSKRADAWEELSTNQRKDEILFFDIEKNLIEIRVRWEYDALREPEDESSSEKGYCGHRQEVILDQKRLERVEEFGFI